MPRYNTIGKTRPALGTELYNRSAVLPMRQLSQPGVTVATSFLARSDSSSLARLQPNANGIGVHPVATRG